MWANFLPSAHFASPPDVPVALAKSQLLSFLSHPPTSPSQATYKYASFTFVRCCFTRCCRSSLATSLPSPPSQLASPDSFRAQHRSEKAFGFLPTHILFVSPLLYLHHNGHILIRYTIALTRTSLSVSCRDGRSSAREPHSPRIHLCIERIEGRKVWSILVKNGLHHQQKFWPLQWVINIKCSLARLVTNDAYLSICILVHVDQRYERTTSLPSTERIADKEIWLSRKPKSETPASSPCPLGSQTTELTGLDRSIVCLHTPSWTKKNTT